MNIKNLYLAYFSPKYTHTLGGFIKDARKNGLRRALWFWKVEARILRKV